MTEKKFKAKCQFVTNRMSQACNQVEATGKQQMERRVPGAEYSSKSQKLLSKRGHVQDSVMIQGVVGQQNESS